MKFLKYTLFISVILAGAVAGGCAADGSFLWEDGSSDNDNDWDDDNDNGWDGDYDNDWSDDTDDDWDNRTGDWVDSRDGDWDDRRYKTSGDEREDYWDDRNSDSGDSDDYWTWGAQTYMIPRTSEMDEIRTLSRTMDLTSDDLMEELRNDSDFRDNLGRSGGPADIMRNSADGFRRQVEDNMTRPDRTLAAFQEVRSSHTRLAEAASRHSLTDRMERMLDRLVETAKALDGLYLRKSG